MGINHSSVLSNDIVGAVLAGFGIWTKPTRAACAVASTKPVTARPTTAHNIYPLRVTCVKDSSPKMAGRMVISGRMADVCAELDRMAA